MIKQAQEAEELECRMLPGGARCIAHRCMYGWRWFEPPLKRDFVPWSVATAVSEPKPRPPLNRPAGDYEWRPHGAVVERVQLADGSALVDQGSPAGWIEKAEVAHRRRRGYCAPGTVPSAFGEGS